MLNDLISDVITASKIAALLFLSIMLGGLSLAFLEIGRLTADLRVVIKQLPKTVDSRLEAEADFTREWIRVVLREQTNILASRVDSLSAELLDRVDSSTNKLDDRSREAVAVLDAAVITIDARASQIQDDLGPTLDNIDVAAGAAGSVATQLSAELPFYLDCQVNPRCLYWQYDHTTESTTDAMTAIVEATAHLPAAVEAIKKTSESTAIITKRWEVPWYRKIGRGLKRLFGF